MQQLAVVDDPLFLEHVAPEQHPERPERLLAARRALESLSPGASPEPRTADPRPDANPARDLAGGAGQLLAPRDATDDELGRVHDAAYLQTLSDAVGGSGYFDGDTYYGPQSVAAARRAAGGAIALVDELRCGNSSRGVALVRPPGHHARPGTAMGFCILNNVAIAAAHARSQGAERVLIVDWDVHHGNGTQEIFYGDETVLFISVHQYPFYPGSGSADEVGGKHGRGYTVNVPLSAGAGNRAYQSTMERIVAPVAARFAPDLVLVSAGFDAHRRDPLGGMRLSSGVYGELLTELGTAVGDAPIGLVLEGGYDLMGLEQALGATLCHALGRAWGGDPDSSAPIATAHIDEIQDAARVARLHWSL